MTPGQIDAVLGSWLLDRSPHMNDKDNDEARRFHYLGFVIMDEVNIALLGNQDIGYTHARVSVTIRCGCGKFETFYYNITTEELPTHNVYKGLAAQRYWDRQRLLDDGYAPELLDRMEAGEFAIDCKNEDRARHR